MTAGLSSHDGDQRQEEHGTGCRFGRLPRPSSFCSSKSLGRRLSNIVQYYLAYNSNGMYGKGYDMKTLRGACERLNSVARYSKGYPRPQPLLSPQLRKPAPSAAPWILMLPFQGAQQPPPTDKCSHHNKARKYRSLSKQDLQLPNSLILRSPA